MTQKEKNDRNKSYAISVGIHAVVMLLLFFIWAYKPPDPPLPETGIVINFGLDEAGFGEEQPETVSEVESEPVEEQPEEQVEEVVEEPVEEVLEEEVVDTPVATETDVVKTDAEAPVKVEEKVEVQKKPEPVVEKKKEEKKEVKKETPKANPNTSFTKRGDTGGSNQGDKKGTVGDQGDKDGDVNADALYGNKGGGGNGSALNMTGWFWDSKPAPKDKSSESGKIVFRIKIDENGEILSVETVTSTVSPSVLKVYKEEVYKTTFHKTSTGTNVASVSTGTITFVIKSK